MYELPPPTEIKTEEYIASECDLRIPSPLPDDTKTFGVSIH